MSIFGFFRKNKAEVQTDTSPTIEDNYSLDYEVRNKLKDAKFYTKGIKLMNEKAQKPIAMFAEYKRKKPDAIRTKTSYFMEASALLTSFQMKYCRGDSFDNLKIEFPTIFKLYTKSFEEGSIYNETLNILSLGILFDTPKILFQDFYKEMKKDNVQDFLFSFLVNSTLLDTEVYDKLIFKKNKVCVELKKIIEAEPNQTIELIHDLLTKDWYTKTNFEVYYNTHTGDGIFLGYYAWCVAAIVKIKNIDDSSFKDNPYYPYDLVHWKR